MDSNKLKNYYECMCIILIYSSLKANHVSSLQQQLEVKVGSLTTLKCLFTESQHSTNCLYIIWMKVNPRSRLMDVLHIDGQKYQTKIKESTTWCDLTINGATLDDTGLYYCLNENNNSFIGDGIKVRVLGEIDVSPSVELFSPSDFLDPDIPFICWVAHAVPSEIRVIWVVNGNEYIGLTESVWWRKNDPSTEFTQSKFWISKSDWEEGKLFSCIVEAGGKNISKSIRSTGTEDDVCLFLLYGISCTALFMIVVAVTTVLVLNKGHRTKEMQKMNRRQRTGKQGKYTTKRTSVTEVQYASLDNINVRQPPQSPLQEDFDLET